MKFPTSRGTHVVQNGFRARFRVCSLDRGTGQTREIKKNKKIKYLKGKVVSFPIQSLIIYQYPFDLLTFSEL